MRNNVRFDLSDWLIHFFRRIDIEKDDAPHVPESFGFGNVNEDINWSALFMLRCAIRTGHLWATWSYRKGIRTIYGPNPAVCFTEMPLAAFIEAGAIREARGEAMSQFGLVFPKAALFQIGANPVIYGLDNRNASIPSGREGGPRILDAGLLPYHEQYRYVTYNPAGNRPIDWTHEREWRWPFRGDYSLFEKEIEVSGIVSESTEIPGLDFHLDALQGLGVVVSNSEQATWITHDILALTDRGKIANDHYAFILRAGELPADGQLRDPDEVTEAISEASVNLEPFFMVEANEASAATSKLVEMANAILNKYQHVETGEPGGAWLWILDNTHPFTRALLAGGRVQVSKDRRYLVPLPEFGTRRGLAQREAMIKELARLVTGTVGIECDYFSVLGSTDPDGVPFYCSNHLDNKMFYNLSWV